jgi:hypothetical protein
MHPDNTVICQVKISRAAMKAAQEAAKLQSTCKRKEKNNIFLHIKSISFNTGAFFLLIFLKTVNFNSSSRNTTISYNNIPPAIHYNLFYR